MKTNSKTGALSNLAVLCKISPKDVYRSGPSKRLETKKRQLINNYSVHSSKERKTKGKKL